MVLAARYGLMFKCDPFLVLEREGFDVQLMTALYEAAARDLTAEVSSDGGR